MHHVRATDGLYFAMKSSGFQVLFLKQKAAATGFHSVFT
jgi:hypothetical protein